MINTFLAKDIPTNNKYSGFDTEELYQKHLLSQPNDWYYRNNTVTYTVNSQGYRCPEFNQVDWANSIVLIGCSNVYGVGIDDVHTLDKELSKLTNCTVINLGAGGTSIQYSLYNAVILRELYPTPKAVVQIWTGIHRYTQFMEDNKVHNHGSWNYSIDDKYNTDINLSTHGYLNIKASKYMWSDTKYYEASYFIDTAELANCDKLRKIDLARDLSHPGIESTKQSALQIYENIK
jgi:hypothetical protein